jgi:hypothetical protein
LRSAWVVISDWVDPVDGVKTKAPVSADSLARPNSRSGGTSRFRVIIVGAIEDSTALALVLLLRELAAGVATVQDLQGIGFGSLAWGRVLPPARAGKCADDPDDQQDEGGIADSGEGADLGRWPVRIRGYALVEGNLPEFLHEVEQECEHDDVQLWLIKGAHGTTRSARRRGRPGQYSSCQSSSIASMVAIS